MLIYCSKQLSSRKVLIFELTLNSFRKYAKFRIKVQGFMINIKPPANSCKVSHRKGYFILVFNNVLSLDHNNVALRTLQP